MKIILTPAIY